MDVLFYILLLVFDSLIMQEFLVYFEGYDWFFEVAKKPFDETGYQVRILYLLDVFVVSITQLL